MMGYSRDSFYRFKELYDAAGGELALQELTRRRPILKNRTGREVEAIVELSLDRPACGQIRIANEVRKLGHSISPAGVRGVWQRHNLETMKKRLKALEAKVAQEGLALSEPEDELAALEKAKSKRRRMAELRANVRGSAGAQNLCRRQHGGRARVRQTWHRHCPESPSPSSTTSKTPITTADLINDQAGAVL